MATKTVKTTTAVKKTPAVKKSVIKKAVAKSSSRKRGSIGIDSRLHGNDNLLDPRVFDRATSESLLNQVIHIYRDNIHQGTSKVKTRGELGRTTKKMYKQKGTGNARHGSKMSPTFVGGGVAFGPTGIKPANLKINRKMKASALAGILTIYAKDKNVEVFVAPEIQKPNAKSVKPLLLKEKTLLVVHTEPKNFIASVQNLENVTLIEAGKLNAYHVALNRHIALTASAHANLITRLIPLLKSRKA